MKLVRFQSVVDWAHAHVYAVKWQRNLQYSSGGSWLKLMIRQIANSSGVEPIYSHTVLIHFALIATVCRQAALVCRCGNVSFT